MFGLGRGHRGGGIWLRNDWLGGAAFADRTRVKTRNATVIGIGMSYQLWSRGATTIGEETP